MRDYNPSKSVPPLRPLPARHDRRIPSDATLHDIDEASKLLTAQFGSGFSPNSLRVLCRSGRWQNGWHFIKPGQAYKLYLPAIQEWVVNQI